MKGMIALFIAVTVIASVVVAGCISSPPSLSSNQTASHTASVARSAASVHHDRILQAVIDDDQRAYVNATWTRTVNTSVQWINDTAAVVSFKLGYSNSSTLHYTAHYRKFSSDAQARDYVASISRGYTSASAVLLKNDIGLTTATSLNNHQNYKDVTNRVPVVTVYAAVRDVGSAYQGSYIIRVSEVVTTFNVTVTKSVASPEPTQRQYP